MIFEKQYEYQPKKKKDPSTCDMYEPGGHYAEWNKPTQEGKYE